MQVVYALQDIPRAITKSIFLAGPSPREQNHLNWRREALEILEELGFDGTVFLPITGDGLWKHSYVDQIDWETTTLNLADQIVFWVPRDLETLPAFTTNVEWGIWFDSGKAILGFPKDAPKMRYLEHHAKAQQVPIYDSLGDTLKEAVSRLGAGAERIDGEREVPLHIWKLPHFQNWYQQLKVAGNRLDGAKLLWSFRVGPNKGFAFAYVLQVNVYVAAEQRNKVNEFIISRPDIATVVAYHPRANLLATEVVIVKEFRSPVCTEDGYVREVPGGSSLKPGVDPLETMVHELKEETGLIIDDPTRIMKIGARQIYGTLLTHRAHVFAVKLNDEELEFLKRQESGKVVHGVESETERTYVEVHRLCDLIDCDSKAIDWGTLGMIFGALLG
ncbi:MAG: nucleoside 2-deoxyribosyltransferase domain-containing protein [Candidatus Paceibacterota bacterium]